MTLFSLKNILLAGGAFVLAKRAGLFGATAEDSQIPPTVFRIPEGSVPINLVDSGLIVGGAGNLEPAPGGQSGFAQGIDPVTGAAIFIDPQSAAATGGGVFVDPQGFARFGSGGFVKLTGEGQGISGTEGPGGIIFGVSSGGGEIIPASFEDPSVLQAKEEQKQSSQSQEQTASEISSGGFSPIGGSEKTVQTVTVKKKETPKVITDVASFLRFF